MVMPNQDQQRIGALEAQVRGLLSQVSNLQNRPQRVSGAQSGTSIAGDFPGILRQILNWGFVWVGIRVNVKAADSEGIVVSANGVATLRKSGGGIFADSNGLYIDTGVIEQKTRVTSQFNKSADVALTDIPDLSATFAPGKSYNFIVRLYVDADVVGGCQFSMAGSAGLGAIIYQLNAINNTTKAFVINSRATSLGGAGVGQVGATVLWVEIVGLITVTTTGTLVPQFAQSASSGVSSVLVGSHMVVRELV